MKYNYCWTHGCNIHDDHTSATCINPTHGHIWHATRKNMCGGSTRNQHKVIFNGYNYSHVSNNTLHENNDDQTVVTSNKSKDKHANEKFYNKHGLLDLGTTDPFLTIESECLNVRWSRKPITITILESNKMTSEFEGNINWPGLPPVAQVGRIVPQLKQHALISVVKLCKAGCEVCFKHNCCLILHKGDLIMYGV